MNNKNEIDVNSLELSVSSFIETKINDRLPSEQEIKQYLNEYCSFLFPNLDEEILFQVNKMLNERFQFKLERGTLIYAEESEPWFKEFKANNECLYFNRYKEYLIKEKGFNKQATDELDENVLDVIMDYLGNPATNFSPRRGLVMGDVQSGKTSTYTGLICKAADAGYKAIIVLTGTVECLRQQTQKRLDEGFVGFDSDHMSKIDDENFWIGVGKIKKKQGVVLTSKTSDFVASTAKNLGFSLSSFKDTVLFVVKKNVSVLNKLLHWLSDLNAENGVIDLPLLIIDDEADNASINTNNSEDENPTKINKCIRKLLNVFTKNNYVGFTATPFANVFINPYESQDLFPRDFIYCLKAPSTYIGAADIFLDDSKYRYSLINNDDCEEVLPISHKKEHEFEVIPSSLEDAIICYFITNVIRDLRGDTLKHRGMLINISRFKSPQEKIKETVEAYISSCLRKFRLYCSKSYDLTDNFTLHVYNIFKTYYSDNCKYDFNVIWNSLYLSNHSIETLTVNSNSKMINYDNYKNTSARLVVIGGLSLSRGLTIEGLSISYLYRKSQVYDVLLQMGRWFGYRNNYDDLFRIWMPSHMVEWYKEITLSVEELKDDLKRMQSLNQKPKDFGIRIRNDKTALKITARNKMLCSSDHEVVRSMFGSWDDAGILPLSLEENIKNYNNVMNGLSVLIDKGFKHTRINKRLVWKDIPKQYVVDILKNYFADKRNLTFNSQSYADFIQSNTREELDLFDIAIVEGDRASSQKVDFFGTDIVYSQKVFSCKDNCIKLNRSKALLVNPVDISYGLTENEKKQAEEIHKNEILKMHPEKDPAKINASAKTYLSLINRRPLLLIYFIDLKTTINYEEETEADENQKIKIKNEFLNSNIAPVGLAIAIPKYEGTESIYCTYKINMVEQYNLSYKDDEEDYND